MEQDVPLREFKAIDQAQERWVIASVPCDCGAAWTATTQNLVQREGGLRDEWEAECAGCGARALFSFDISEFFGHEEEIARWLAERLPGVEPRVLKRVARKVGPPFGRRFRNTVQRLAKDGDVATLLYLRAEIDRALQSVIGKADDAS